MNGPNKSSPIFEHIAADHARMPDLLNELHRIINDRAEAPKTIAAAIGSFMDYLRDHFEHEDNGGFFDELATQAPRLLDRARDVSGEHAGLLVTMKAFRDSATTGDATEAWWDKMDQEFQRVMKELMHHEQRERELLQDAFVDDIGTAD